MPGYWAMGSCCSKRVAQEAGTFLTVFEAIGDDAKREGLDFGDHLIARRPVCHHSGQIDDLGDPAAVRLLFDLHAQRHDAGEYTAQAPGMPEIGFPPANQC